MNKKLIKQIEDYFKNTPDEEILKKIEELQPREHCKPESCMGECQGMGHCEMAVGFRKQYQIKLPKICGDE